MLCYQALDLHLVGYSDAEWGGDLDQYKLTSDYALFLNDGAISQSSKKQHCITLSTMELEYVTCSVVVWEGVWLRRFIVELGIVVSTSEPITIHCNNKVVLAHAMDSKYHGKTQYIGI